jgi:hypothetical protein
MPRGLEKLRPFVARVEAILRAGGLVYGARGAALGSATLLACPGRASSDDAPIAAGSDRRACAEVRDRR